MIALVLPDRIAACTSGQVRSSMYTDRCAPTAGAIIVMLMIRTAEARKIIGRLRLMALIIAAPTRSVTGYLMLPV
jgi:hypothetical protein